MKTRINLLTPDLLPPELRISFERTVLLVLIVLVVGGAANAWFYWKNSFLTQELAQHHQARNHLQNQKKDLEQKVSNHKPDPRLVAQVKAMDERLLLKQQLLAELDRRSDITSEGFSILLTDLAGVSANKLWLTRIQAANQKFSFEGYSVQAQTVPFWIDQLKSTETLKGYAFSAINMDRGEGQPIAFVLSSKPEEKPVAAAEGAK
ncbi:fimbrial assembly protein [Shewanella submarina]|uniref:Fimbrial assembly protein n=1 Tax=Shewanella submarina TaxID=2016376 RepID=A0ABV7GF13_9GAMM|nr:fimbrial assembly protein [Shewanella submarina]MCL1035606.1 fimbrial assembly protein [Shewanella submarina]